jgi:predicted metal-dependent peptidase
MKSAISPHAQRLQRARIQLLLREPFFGSLLMHLKPIETDAVATFSTDGRSLFFNPQFMDTLDDEQIKTVLAHEVLHCALLHHTRIGQRDLKRFNQAADYAINNFLDNYNQQAVAAKRTAPFPIIPGILVDHQYDGLSAEEIYAKLTPPPQPPQAGQGPATPAGGGSGGSGSPGGQPQPGAGNGAGAGTPQSAIRNPQSPAPSPGEFTAPASDDAGTQQAEAEWKCALQAAALAAKERGTLPAEIARLVEEQLHPKVPWREVLRTFLTSVARDDYSWAQPNRRYASAGVILPGLHSPRLGRIVVAVDTSGSIGPREFEEFVGEVRGILFDCRPQALVLAQCDSRLHSWEELDPFDDAPVKFRGGGGTDFRPVFDRIAEEPEPPVAVVYLTDLMGEFPDNEPGYPVLWAATSSQQAPWGVTLTIQ